MYAKHKRLAKRAQTVLRELEHARALYNELDSIAERLKKSSPIALSKNEILLVIDNFKNKNAVFKTTSVKRYEIKIINKGD